MSKVKIKATARRATELTFNPLIDNVNKLDVGGMRNMIAWFIVDSDGQYMELQEALRRVDQIAMDEINNILGQIKNDLRKEARRIRKARQ